ncbi:MAG TPA: hypothetical protein VKE40_24705 [Gemmataceae bacterium]|nr:hypothetical protein [Gemmataceae bacterium]
MAWVNWSRKSTEVSVDHGPLGVDLNAGRARAAHGKVTRNKLFPLDDPHTDLVLAVSLEKRAPEIGRGAYAVSRKLPHALCAGYLPYLGQPQEWKAGRYSLTADAAVALAFDRLRAACQGHDGLSLAVPTYLSLAQVNKLVGLAEKAKLKVRGTATTPLALAAERATHYLYGQREDPSESARPGRSISTTSVLIVDADEHAMTATAVRISEDEVRTTATAVLPRLSVRQWRERLLDALSDRCVRLCRRDPRDNAEVEQMLFDQIEDAIDRARTGQRVSISVRSTHWFQDLVHAPADLDAFCSPLSRLAADEMRKLLCPQGDNDPPRAAWLTHDAGRLPGLAAALHQNMAERSSVRVLHPEAAAAAAVNLVERWSAGELPRTHLDTTIPLPPRPDTRLFPNRSQHTLQ